jgi:hypothetical protein
MTTEEALEVTVPFGPCFGWPLRAVISRRPAVAVDLVRNIARFFGEFREAVAAIADLPEVQRSMKIVERERKTRAVNRRMVDAWAFR